MPGKIKQAVKKVAAKKAAGRKTVSKDTSSMVASAPAATTTSSATTKDQGSQCGENCITTQDQAIQYMNAEVLWSTLFVEAWTTPATLKALQDNANNANAYLEAEGVKRGLPVKVPPGVTLKIVFDTADTVHLLMPAVQNIPPRPVDMVPHAL